MLFVIALLAIPPVSLALLTYVLWWRQEKPKLGNPEDVPRSTQQDVAESIMRSSGTPPI